MKPRRNVLTSTLLAFISLLLFNIDAPKAEEFHVTTAAEFLRALITARDNGEANTILLAAGTYKASDNNSAFVSVAFFNITIKGEPGTTSDDVILDLTGGSELYLETHNDCVSATIEGITLKNGGGVNIYSLCPGNITLRNNKILNNSSGSAVDIMHHTDTRANIILVGNTIEGNYCGGVMISYSGDITIENNIITGNNTSCVSGGGIYIEESGNIYLDNNTVSENENNSDKGCKHQCPLSTGVAKGGGGICITDSGDVTLINNTITGNSVPRYDAGGCCILDSGDVTLINNTIMLNPTESDRVIPFKMTGKSH